MAIRITQIGEYGGVHLVIGNDRLTRPGTCANLADGRATLDFLRLARNNGLVLGINVPRNLRTEPVEPVGTSEVMVARENGIIPLLPHRW